MTKRSKKGSIEGWLDKHSAEISYVSPLKAGGWRVDIRSMLGQPWACGTGFGDTISDAVNEAVKDYGDHEMESRR